MGPKPNQNGAHETFLGKSVYHMTAGHYDWLIIQHGVQSETLRSSENFA
jgi:hypothetical protein